MPERLRFLKKHQYLGKFFCLAYKDGEKERDKGHWIDITFDASMCSVCQNIEEYETKYCPECGAKMDGDNNGK